MPRSARSHLQNLSPRPAVTVPALSVVFKTASYPELEINEAESEMIARTAASVLGVSDRAVLSQPQPRYLGQGDGSESLFEVHLRQRFASVGALNGNAAVVHVSTAGPAPRPAVASRKLKLPRPR